MIHHLHILYINVFAFSSFSSFSIFDGIRSFPITYFKIDSGQLIQCGKDVTMTI
jgi:hypothetical protein